MPRRLVRDALPLGPLARLARLVLVAALAFAFLLPVRALADAGLADAGADDAAAMPVGAANALRVRDRTVFVFRAARAGRSQAERARAANAVIEPLLAHPEALEAVRFEENQGAAVVYIGAKPIFTLGPEDVEASGEASLAVLAAQVTARVGDAVESEKKRGAIATTVFSLSLLVFSAVIVFIVLRRISELAARLRMRLVDDPERVGALSLGRIEFVSAGAARGAASIGLTLTHRLVQVALLYGWLIFGFSLFEITRGLTSRLTGLVVAPLSALATRLGGALPLVVVSVLALFGVTVLVRFVGLFFDSVSRGDTRLGWLPRDLARPTSLFVRVAIVVFALLLAGPLLTGESDAAATRLGMVALGAIGLAATPLLASAIVGIDVVFARKLRRGDHVELAGRRGRVVEATIFDVRLEDAAGAEIRVPHLATLARPLRVLSQGPDAEVSVVVDPAADAQAVETALLTAARELGGRGRAELVHVDADGAHWRVSSVAASPSGMTLGRAVHDALRTSGIALGRDTRVTRGGVGS